MQRRFVESLGEGFASFKKSIESGAKNIKERVLGREPQNPAELAARLKEIAAQLEQMTEQLGVKNMTRLELLENNAKDSPFTSAKEISAGMGVEAPIPLGPNRGASTNELAQQRLGAIYEFGRISSQVWSILDSYVRNRRAHGEQINHEVQNFFQGSRHTQAGVFPGELKEFAASIERFGNQAP